MGPFRFPTSLRARGRRRRLAAREWLVLSGIAERLRVEAPFRDSLDAGKFEVSARLTNQATVSVGARVQRNQLTRLWSRSLTVQVALKSRQ